MIFKYEYIEKQKDVRKHIQECEGQHTQQAIYSTFHDALTQICYGCLAVRTTIYRQETKLMTPMSSKADEGMIDPDRKKFTVPTHDHKGNPYPPPQQSTDLLTQKAFKYCVGLWIRQ